MAAMAIKNSKNEPVASYGPLKDVVLAELAIHGLVCLQLTAQRYADAACCGAGLSNASKLLPESRGRKESAHLLRYDGDALELGFETTVDEFKLVQQVGDDNMKSGLHSAESGVFMFKRSKELPCHD